jgi:hypothetical protein
MISCPSCGAEDVEGKKFCRHCGARLETSPDEATTWRLPAGTGPSPGQPTAHVGSAITSEPSQPTGPAYMPPPGYYPPSYPAPYQQPAPAARQPSINLGEWLSTGWRVYRENWAVMTVGTFLASLFSLFTFGILGGPTLMGLYRMSFKTLRGEVPVMGDLFKWEGRFLQSFLAFLIFGALHFGLSNAGDGGLFAILALIIYPFLVMSLGLAMPLILERKMDVVAAINEVGRRIFSRDGFMWWLVGLVFGVIGVVGFFACGVGLFVTVPWMIASASVAYRDTFGLDDPNRTQP